MIDWMNCLFWASFGLAFYTYCGYVLYLLIRAWIHRRPIASAPILPSVSIVMAVRNESANLPRKLENLKALHYPKDRIEVLVCSDGSTDETVRILRAHGDEIVTIILEQPCGKARALNEAVLRAQGELLFFQDARQSVGPEALSELVKCFADPSIGAVSGELILVNEDGTPSPDGLGVYWKIEKTLRKLESETGSVVGATGAIYAIRRQLYTQMPEGTILDDVFIPMHVARMGKRVVFQSSAIARDSLSDQSGREFRRKVRTLTGNYQLLRVAPWILTFRNPILFRFISHKFLRLIMPLVLLVMLAASGLAAGPFYRAMLLLQVMFYSMALIGVIVPSFRQFRPAAIAHTFVMLNVAAVVAFCNFMRGKTAVWA